MAIEQTLWWAHVSVSEMLQPMFATCLVRSQTCLLRKESIREAWGLHRNELNKLQSSIQIVSRAGADAYRPLLLSIPLWVFLKCCSPCLLHVWSEAKHVCYEKRAFGRPEGYIEMSSTNCKAAVRSCPEQALMPIDHCYYPFPFLSI